MGRFYQTSKPEFIEDIIYQPPWKLIQEVLATKQKGYDDTMAATELLKNLEIRHRDTEEENQAVAEIKNYYNAEVDALQNQLKTDPNSYNNLLPKIRDLSRRLNQDIKEGNISKIQGTYDKFADWQKRFEKTKETDPIRYAKLIQEADNKWAGNSLKNGVWGQEDMYATPDFDKKLKDAMDRVKADFEKHGVEHFNGLNITKVVNGRKVLDPLKLQEAAYLNLVQDPAFMAYAGQVNRLGMGNYEANPFVNRYKNKEGKVITEEDYNALSEEDKKGYTQGRIANSEHALYNYMRNAALGAYTEWETDQNTKANPGATTAYVQQQTNARDAANRASREKIANDNLNLGIARLEWEKLKHSEDKRDKELTNIDKVLNDPKASEEVKNNARIARNNILGYGAVMDFKADIPTLDSALGSGKKELVIDAFNRANIGPGMKGIMNKYIGQLAEGKLTKEQFIQKSVNEYLQTPAGKREYQESMANKTRMVEVTLPDGVTSYSPNKTKESAEKEIRRDLTKKIGKSFETKMGTQFEKYNANIQQQAHELTSHESKLMGDIMNSNPDAYTYYKDGVPVKERVPLSSSQIGIVGNITPVKFGAGGKGPNGTLVTEVTIGGEKYFAVPNDKDRTSGTILAHRNFAQSFVNPTSELGRTMQNQERAVRTSVFNEFLRSNSNNGTHYSPVLKDPAGTKYGLQAVSSGSTKTGVGLFHIYAPDENGEYSPVNRITKEPLDIKEISGTIKALERN